MGVSSGAFAQDILYLLSGDEIETKLTEISSSELKYKRIDNLDGPVFVIERNKVFKVKYSNVPRAARTISVRNTQTARGSGLQVSRG